MRLDAEDVVDRVPRNRLDLVRASVADPEEILLDRLVDLDEFNELDVHRPPPRDLDVYRSDGVREDVRDVLFPNMVLPVALPSD